MSRSQMRFHLWKGENKRLRTLALTTLCLVSCGMFFLRQFAWAGEDLAAPADDKNVVSSQPSAALQEIDKAKEEQRKFIEKINTMQGAEEITCRYNLDGSFTITDGKDGTVSLFDKDGKTLSITDTGTGKITNFNSDGKIESITFASGEKKEYLYDERGGFLEVKEYNNLDVKSTSGDLQAASQEIEVAPALVSSSLATNTEEGEKTVDKIEPNLSLIGQSNTISPEFKPEEESIPKIIIDNVISESQESPIFTKEALFNISNWLKTQVENIVNCATRALETVVSWLTNEPANQLNDKQVDQQTGQLAENALLADILGGVITENTQGILQTSMYAIKEAAKKEEVDLVGAKISYEELLASLSSNQSASKPIICHLTAGHYIVVIKADDVNVGYIDSRGMEQIISKEIFIRQWSGNVLIPVIGERLSVIEKTESREPILTNDELKQIRGSGLTAHLYTFDEGTSLEANGFTSGTTGEGTVELDADVVYGEGGYSIKLCGNEDDESKTFVEKTVTAAEDNEVSFYYKVSSEYGCDYLKFYIDGEEQTDARISGEKDWAYKTYALTAGEHTLKWSYEKDNNFSDDSDAGWVDNITLYEDEAEEPEEDDDAAIVEIGDYIGVKYTGYLEDGSVFDSNEDSKKLFYFTVGSGDVIVGFDEAVIGLSLGDKITVTIPPEKAYGPEGSGHSLSGKTLIFDIEVLEINTRQEEVVGDTPYTCSFDDGASLETNGFTTGTASGGSIILEKDAVYGGYYLKLQGNNSDSGSAYVEKTFILEKDGKVGFAWKVSSDASYDCLKFYIDGVEQDGKISGDVANWAYKTYALTAGEHTLKWSYEKDGSASNGEDAGWVDAISVYKNETEEPQDILKDFFKDYMLDETENNYDEGYDEFDWSKYFDNSSLFDFNDDGGSNWAPSSFGEVVMEGGLGGKQAKVFAAHRVRMEATKNLYGYGPRLYAAAQSLNFDDGISIENNGFATGTTREGAVVLEKDVASGGCSMKICGNNSQDSVTYAEKVLNLKEAAQVKFLWKVSSERGSDYLKFYIDGVEYDEISGEADWAGEVYDLPKGKHALRWVYEKNGSISSGEDAGWVDEISVSEAGAKEQGGEKTGETSSEDSACDSAGNFAANNAVAVAGK